MKYETQKWVNNRQYEQKSVYLLALKTHPHKSFKPHTLYHNLSRCTLSLQTSYSPTCKEGLTLLLQLQKVGTLVFGAFILHNPRHCLPCPATKFLAGVRPVSLVYPLIPPSFLCGFKSQTVHIRPELRRGGKVQMRGPPFPALTGVVYMSGSGR